MAPASSDERGLQGRNGEGGWVPLDNAQDSPPVEAWVGLGRHGRRRNAKVLGRKGFRARPNRGAGALAFVEPEVRQLRSGCLVAVSPHSGTDPRHGRVVCRGAPRRVTWLTDGSPPAIRRDMPRVTTGSLALVLLCVPAARAAAQGSDTLTASVCEGRTVTRVEITPGRPPYRGTAAKWRAAARAIGLHHATTKAHVIQSFMSLHVGRPCTEFRRAESERVLRAQPFLADARVRVVPDTGGGVAALVQTTDEIPVLVGGRFRGINPDALALGNSNIGGVGLLLEGAWERPRGYRTGYGGRLVAHTAFDRPYVVSIDAYRHRIGHD